MSAELTYVITRSASRFEDPSEMRGFAPSNPQGSEDWQAIPGSKNGHVEMQVSINRPILLMKCKHFYSKMALFIDSCIDICSGSDLHLLDFVESCGPCFARQMRLRIRSKLRFRCCASIRPLLRFFEA